MDQETLIKKFYDLIPKRTRDKDYYIDSVIDTFKTSPELVESSLLYILQQSFKLHRKNALMKNSERYKFLARITRSILGSVVLTESQKKVFAQNLMQYSLQCSRSLSKEIRMGIVEFLIILHNFNLSFLEDHSNELKIAVKRLLHDENSTIRRSALKIAVVYNMKDSVQYISQHDPIGTNRKAAIGLLQIQAHDDLALNFFQSLNDSDCNVRLRTLNFYSKNLEKLCPNALKSIFFLLNYDQNQVIRKFAKEIISKFIIQVDFTPVLQNILEKIETKYQSCVINGLNDILKNNSQEVYNIIKKILPELISEKEKISLGSLFLLRICFGIIKEKEFKLREIVNEFGLESEILHILKKIFELKYDENYFFKLQNMIFVSNFDGGEEYMENLISFYLEICKNVPLSRLKLSLSNFGHNEALINRYLMIEIEENLIFAENEEDIISTIVVIIREIYKDSENDFILHFKHKLIDEVTLGVIGEEREGQIIVPLNLKVLKSEKKIKMNQEESINYNEELKNKKPIVIDVEDYDEKEVKLKLKKEKYVAQIQEKTYRGLLIVAYVLKYADLSREFNPEYMSFTLFIKESLKNSKIIVSNLAIKCLCYLSLLSKDISSEYFTEFFHFFTVDFSILQLNSVISVFDLLISRRIKEPDKVKICLKQLRLLLNNWNANNLKHEVSIIIVEGFCKLLVKNIIQTKAIVIAKLFEIYFNENILSEMKVIIKAFLQNYMKISEESSVELTNAYIIYLSDLNNKKCEFKLFDKNIIEIVHLVDPKIETPYAKSENLHLLIFEYCYHHYHERKKFFQSIISSLNLSSFEGPIGKYVKNKLDDLVNKFPTMAKCLMKNIRNLPQISELVEDISFREYKKRVEDIEIQSIDFQKEKLGLFDYY